MEKSNTGKSQFSYYFKTKEGLVHACLEFLSEVIKAGEVPTGYYIKDWKDLEGWFQTYLDFQKSTDFKLSCPMGTIGNEVREDQEILRNEIKNFMTWANGSLATFFKRKIKEKELSKNADPEALADLFISIMQGGMLLTKMTRDHKMFKNASKEALNYIKALRLKTKK